MRNSFLLRLAACAVALLVSPSGARADAVLAKIAVRPALWTVHGKGATLYLFGSIHLLPQNLTWHTQAIDAALSASKIFVFEAPIDDSGKAQMTDFLRDNGMLPDGTTLPDILPKDALADYRRAVADAGLPEHALDRDQPWLAEASIEVASLQQMRYLAADGVDQELFRWASAHGKTLRYFETPAQQLALLIPRDKGHELADFDSDLKAFRNEQNTIGALVDAWGTGDVKTVGRLMRSDMASDPAARKAIIDDRNRNWIKTLDTLLAGNSDVFVTVGTGHLVGPKGVPALLRAQGYRVDGP